nr:hypothetical protein [Tanacetum cinerariifolium]
MAASAIIVSFDSSDESVGSPPSRGILFGDIPTVIPSISVIAPETFAIASVISAATLWLRRILVMTVKKRVGPFPTRRLALRRVSRRSSDHRPSSSSSATNRRQFILRVWMHQIRLILDLRLELYHLDWVTLRDSSKRPLHLSLHSAGPSRKRCRSPDDSVPSSTPVTRSLDPTRADLLPPRKRFRDSYSSKTSIEEDTKIDTTETKDGREMDIVDRDDARDRVEIDPRDVRDDTEEYEANTIVRDTIEVGIDPMLASVANEESEEPAGEDSSYSSGTRDGIVRSFEDMPIDLDDVVRDFYHHMYEVCIDRIVGIENVQRRLEADQLIASGKRAGMTKRIESLRSENLKLRALLCIERDHVDSFRLYISHSQEEF